MPITRRDIFSAVSTTVARASADQAGRLHARSVPSFFSPRIYGTCVNICELGFESLDVIVGLGRCGFGKFDHKIR